MQGRRLNITVKLTYHTYNSLADAVINLVVMAAFSLMLSFFNLIFKIKVLHVYIRMPLHYILTTVSLYLVLLISAGELVSNTQNIRLVMLLFYSIIYVIVSVIYICIRETRKKPKEKEEKEYNKIYK